MFGNWVENRRRRARLRLVEQNLRATAYLEDLVRDLGQADLARLVHEQWNRLHLVQFCVEDSGMLDLETERQQMQMNRQLRSMFRKLQGHVQASFDALFRPQDGWERYFRLRGL